MRVETLHTAPVQEGERVTASKRQHTDTSMKNKTTKQQLMGTFELGPMELIPRARPGGPGIPASRKAEAGRLCVLGLLEL